MEIKISDKNPLVCFFDSGIGGLNLLYKCALLLPHCYFNYYADNYNVPYGNRTGSEILKLVTPIFDVIASKNPSAAVVACNTVTAQCIGELRAKYAFPIIGIQPAVKQAAERKGKLLALATAATVRSEAFINLVKSYGADKTDAVACPDLAEYIEENVFDLSQEKVVSLLPKVKTDSVVLGCTHYVYIEKIIENFYGCPVFDGISGTADHLRSVLGISDHRGYGKLIADCERGQKCGEISFIGGDSDKNSRVFGLLCKNRF